MNHNIQHSFIKGLKRKKKDTWKHHSQFTQSIISKDFERKKKKFILKTIFKYENSNFFLKNYDIF